MTFAEAMAMATARLNAAGIERPERDARRLVAFAAGTAPDRLTLHLRDDFTAAAALFKPKGSEIPPAASARDPIAVDFTRVRRLIPP